MKSQPHRFSRIDSLRGLAAFAVLLYHYFAAYGLENNYTFSFSHYFGYGFFGVQLFFIISGFVIYYSILKSKSSSIFLLKRAIRLYPTYWLCLFLTFGVVHLFPLSEHRMTNWGEMLVNLTMLSPLFHIKLVDPSYWSLLIELFFYLLMAALLYFDQFKRIYLIIFFWLLLIIICNEVVQIPAVGALFNLRYGSLFIAGICFYKIKAERDRSSVVFILLGLSFLCSIVVMRDLEGIIPATTIIYGLFAFALFVNEALLNSRIMVFLGSISYALYLVHQNIGFVILNFLRQKGLSSPFILIIPIGLCVLLSWLITVYFEGPVMKYLNSFLPGEHPINEQLS